MFGMLKINGRGGHEPEHANLCTHECVQEVFLVLCHTLVSVLQLRAQPPSGLRRDCRLKCMLQGGELLCILHLATIAPTHQKLIDGSPVTVIYSRLANV